MTLAKCLRSTALVVIFIAWVAVHLLTFALPVIGALWILGWLK
jgi:hypothetical protein